MALPDQAVDAKNVAAVSERAVRLQEMITSALMNDEKRALSVEMAEQSDAQLEELDKQLNGNLETAVVRGEKTT